MLMARNARWQVDEFSTYRWPFQFPNDSGRTYVCLECVSMPELNKSATLHHGTVAQVMVRPGAYIEGSLEFFRNLARVCNEAAEFLEEQQESAKDTETSNSTQAA